MNAGAWISYHSRFNNVRPAGVIMVNSMVKRDDIRDQPAYTLAEATRYLKVAPATLRAWFLGRRYPKGDSMARSKPLIRPAKNPPPTLSFWNLIEAHVLRSLRIDHEVKMDSLRKAIDYAERQLRINRLLLSQELRTDAGKLLLERYGQLIDLSASGQLAMRRMFREHLARVVWDEWKFPIRLYPFAPGNMTKAQDCPIAISANIAFGRPVLERVGVSTATIVSRIDCGESEKDIADDYGVSPDDIDNAVLYERAA